MYVIPPIAKKGQLDDNEKIEIIQDVNNRVGGDINDLVNAYNLENELSLRKKQLVSCLNLANNEVPSKIFSAIRKAILNTNQIEGLKTRRGALDTKVQTFYNETESLRVELDKRFMAINKLEQALEYMKSYEKIDALSRQMKQCSEDEQMVLLYGELKEMCKVYNKGHRAAYIKEYLHYWHNVLKDKITKHYEDVLKQMKWPFVSGTENTPPKESLVKFNNLTRYLFLIQEPEDEVTKPVSEEVVPESNPCLPVKILLRPLKKRFLFHFTGSRQTARIDRPEWFLTQTLTWIKDHQAFVSAQVQPIADKLDLKNVRAVDEFNAGLIALAAERLYTVLALYHTQVAKGEIVDVDAAFAHAVDETLGFNRELSVLIGHEENSVLSVLTKAETFVRWLSVEKKYALAKMDETLGNEQWGEPVAAGVGAASGAVLWVPRAADWFVSLLKTIEDRYAALPQPGHRLQFLELQLELIEEWRVRLMQLMNAGVDALAADTFLAARGPQPLPAVVNAAHYTRSVLLQWAHSLHYLQLHYYRRQFQHFTHQHHEENSSPSPIPDDDNVTEEQTEDKPKPEAQMEDAMSLNEVEQRAKNMAINAITRRNSRITDTSGIDISSPVANLAVNEPLGVDEDIEVAGVFAEAPALLARLRDAGLATLSEHILLEFKAGLRDYKRQKWHGLVVVEARALSVSAALCGPLGALCVRLRAACAALAPPLAAELRAHLATILDHHIFEEVVLESWFNTGGTMQFTHDVKRNLVPAFAPPNKVASQVNQLPKLLEACKLLNLDYDDARRLRAMLAKNAPQAADTLTVQGIRHITPNEALQILNQRTDLSDATSPSSVMELF